MKIVTHFLNQNISRDNLFYEISNLVTTNKKLKLKIVEDLIKRENEITTGLGENIAIPHAAFEELKEPVLVFVQNKIQMEWNSLDGQGVNLVFCILTSKKNPETHLEIIAAVSQILLNEELKQKLFKAKTDQEIRTILSSISQNQKKEQVPSHQNNRDLKYDLVAITACPSGLAHTFLARDALLNEAKKRNLKIKVETRGANGIENKLTKQDLATAKKLILAVDKEIDLSEYKHQNIYRTRTIDVVKNPAKCFEDQKNNKTKLLYNSFYTSVTNAGTYLFPVIKILGFVLGILYLLNKTLANSNTMFFADWDQGISAIAKCLLFIFAGFISYSLSKKNEGLIFSFITAIIFGIVITTNNVQLRSISLIEILFIGLFWGWFPPIVEKGLKKIKFEYLFLKSLLKFVAYLLGMIIFLILRIFVMKYLEIANNSVLNWVIDTSNNYWWFNAITVFILANCYILDFGKDFNKWTLVTCYLFYTISMSFNIDKLWVYPFTVILFAPAIPNFNASLTVFINKRKYDKKTIEIAKKTFKDGFRPITESTIPLLKIFKNKLVIANFCSVLCGSILIGIFKLRFFGGISSPLGFLFGYVDQPTWFYGASWCLMYLSSIAIGVTVLTLSTIGERKKSHVIR